jgi:hypothetical protein
VNARRRARRTSSALAAPLSVCYSACSSALAHFLRQGLRGRGVAQPGSAPGSGPGGRRFKSSRPDHFFFKHLARQYLTGSSIPAFAPSRIAVIPSNYCHFLTESVGIAVSKLSSVVPVALPVATSGTDAATETGGLARPREIQARPAGASVLGGSGSKCVVDPNIRLHREAPTSVTKKTLSRAVRSSSNGDGGDDLVALSRVNAPYRQAIGTGRARFGGRRQRICDDSERQRVLRNGLAGTRSSGSTIGISAWGAAD